MRFASSFLLGLFIICFTSPATAAIDASAFSDDELIIFLASKNRQEAWDAMNEIVRRGPQMFPRLMKLRGNTSYLPNGIAYSNYIFPTSAPLKAEYDPRVPSMEVTALYLISAIYYQQLKFNPVSTQVFMVLVDKRKDPTRRTGGNTPETIDPAWKATLTWLGDCSILGIKRMRAARKAPLGSSQIDWAQ